MFMVNVYIEIFSFVSVWIPGRIAFDSATTNGDPNKWINLFMLAYLLSSLLCYISPLNTDYSQYSRTLQIGIKRFTKVLPRSKKTMKNKNSHFSAVWLNSMWILTVSLYVTLAALYNVEMNHNVFLLFLFRCSVPKAVFPCTTSILSCLKSKVFLVCYVTMFKISSLYWVDYH